MKLTHEAMGPHMFTSASPLANAAAALAAWEQRPSETIVTNGDGYLVYPGARPEARGWYQTSPEEITALLRQDGEPF